MLEKLRAHQSLLFRIESVLHEKFWQQEEEKKVHSELQGAGRGGWGLCFVGFQISTRRETIKNKQEGGLLTI